MKKLYTLACAFLSLSLTQAQVSKCLTVQPDPISGKDATFSNRTDFIDQNYGDHHSNRLLGGTGSNVGSAEQDWRFSTQISFIDELPENIVIDSASLVLYNNDTETYLEAHGQNAVSVYLIEESWEEDAITWNNQPLFGSRSYASIPQHDNNFDSLIVDITGLIKEVVENGAENNGFLFKLNNETPYQGSAFFSSDHSDNTKRPLWNVCYSHVEEVTIIENLDGSKCAYVKADSLSGKDATFSNRTDFIDQNYGDHPSNRLLGGTGSNVGSAEQDWRFSTQISFIDELPDTIVIDSASLVLYNNDTETYLEAHGQNAVSVYLIEELWEEDEITWNNQPLFGSEAYASIPQHDNNFDSLIVDITGLIKEVVENGAENNGFLFKLNNETPYQGSAFFSSDYENYDKVPTWKVCYSNVDKILSSIENENKTMLVYPNPSTGLLNFNNETTGVVLTIQGTYVTEFVNATSLNLGEFGKGVYLIKTENTVNKVVIK